MKTSFARYFSNSISKIGGSGRTCPLNYHYGAESLASQADDAQADVLFVIGGLYGNLEALQAIEQRVSEDANYFTSERQHKMLSKKFNDKFSQPKRTLAVFNGDFNFFNARSRDWEVVNDRIMQREKNSSDLRFADYLATLGNVEVEVTQFLDRIGMDTKNLDEYSDGCGCAYPRYVSDATVERSNRIVARLRSTAKSAEITPRSSVNAHRMGTLNSDTDPNSSIIACKAKGIAAWMRGLPKYMAVRMGSGTYKNDCSYTSNVDKKIRRKGQEMPPRVGIIHGDPNTLAGWAFSCESMNDPLPDWKLRKALGIVKERGWGTYLETDEMSTINNTSAKQVKNFLEVADVDAFACTHTCVPFGQVFQNGNSYRSAGAIINNGAAGMPNFDSIYGRFGLMTRIEAFPAKSFTQAPKKKPSVPFDSLYGAFVRCNTNWYLRIDAVPIKYDHNAFIDRFETIWPKGSAAYVSYRDRIIYGLQGFEPRQAARTGFELR